MRGLENLTGFEIGAVIVVLIISLLGIGYAFWLRQQILRQETGTDKMREVWGFIKSGANAYLGQQFRTIRILIAVLTLLLAASVWVVEPTAEANRLFGANATLVVAIGRAVAFLMGSIFSYTVGYVGMNVAVEGNVRVAAASLKGYNPALQTAYRSGTVTGMLTVGLGLLGGTLIFMVFGVAAPDALLGFGFGGSLIALFMRVGGGIYTKAADVGADLVGKVEAGIPEDDPRNAAVIADLVGDNVGDCAGMAADVFESFEVTIVSALILGIVLGTAASGPDGTIDMRFVIFPLILRGIGVIASLIGNTVVRTDETKRDAMGAMNRGFYLAAVVSAIGFAAVTIFYLGDWRPFWATMAGLVLAEVRLVPRACRGTRGRTGVGARWERFPLTRRAGARLGTSACWRSRRSELGCGGDTPHLTPEKRAKCASARSEPCGNGVHDLTVVRREHHRRVAQGRVHAGHLALVKTNLELGELEAVGGGDAHHAIR